MEPLAPANAGGGTRPGDVKDDWYFEFARTEILPLVPPTVHRVLEIGCGAGGTLAWLRTVRPLDFVAGVELMPEPAARARNVCDTVVVGNVESEPLPFSNDTFDLILGLDVFEHLVDPWSVVRRLHGHLRPGGCLIASIPNIAHHSASLPLLRGRWQYAPAGILDSTHLRFFVEDTAKALVSGSGLVVDRFERIIEVPWNLEPIIGWRLNQRVQSAAARLWQGFTYQFLLRATRPL